VRIGILEPDAFSPTAQARLGQFGELSAYSGGPLTDFLADKDVLFVRLGYRIDADFLIAAPKLRWLCSPTTGLTHIDLDALQSRQVKLLSLKGETTFLDAIRATPEHAVGLLLALIRNYRIAFLNKDNAHWDRDRCRGEELNGMAVGVIGFGRVGRRLAKFLQAFDAKVDWYDPFVTEATPGTTRQSSLETLLAASRAIVLAASYEPGVQPILDARKVAALSGKYFVNIARGELVDDAALLAAVEGGLLAGCAVDVIAGEHEPERRARWIAATRAANVIVTPHIAGATFASMRATEEFLAGKLVDALGAPPGANLQAVRS
jgi:D-3-phosphoglycerate dehydrogenase / 2-oxoglutarate reductase